MDTRPAFNDEDKRMAQKCVECPLCNYARRKQRGLVFRILLGLENRLCPYGVAYTKVFNRKPHDPLLMPEPSVPSPDSIPQ